VSPLSKPRHRAREIALQMVYRYDVAEASTGKPAPGGEELIAEIRQHFEHFRVPAELREFAAQLVAGTLAALPELDQLIETHASHWKVSRMPFVDRGLLRMAVYELKHLPESPPSVVIDEAIELAKEFGSAESPAFVNGVLDAIRATLRAGA
jgi:transcription antitermination protein NusB